MNQAQFLKAYDAIYDIANGLLRKYNPCKHDSDGICEEDRLHHNGRKHGCCGGCKWLTSKGCRVRALSCKLWLCPGVEWSRNGELTSKLFKLKAIAYKYHLATSIRQPRKHSLNEYMRYYQGGAE
jgi:hypothetical protein